MSETDEKAVATRDEGNLLVPPEADDTEASVVITEVAERGDVMRFETFVWLPPTFQYVIPRRGKRDDDGPEKVGITADGYDYLNRSMGVSFFLPDFVPDEKGELVRNPIHRPDYIYLRMTALWYTEVGQLVAATEDLEVDFKNVHQAARLETWNSAILLDDERQPIISPDGHPKVVLPSADDEKKAAKALTQLRTMGLRYAQTVLRTRLLKVAIGVRSLKGPIRPQRVRVVGWKDAMNPQTRLAKAQSALSAMYSGNPESAEPLSQDELRAAEPDDADARTDAVVSGAMGVVPQEPQGDLPGFEDLPDFDEEVMG
jgi:hypothetical protein